MEERQKTEHTHTHKKHRSWEMTHREITAPIDVHTNQLKLLHHCVRVFTQVCVYPCVRVCLVGSTKAR